MRTVTTESENTAHQEVAAQVNDLLADVFVLYMKTKNFHWHVSGPNFRDYHLMFDEQATQIIAMVDELAERCRKLGQQTLHSLEEATERSRLEENNDDFVSANAMIAELLGDNERLVQFFKEAHAVCDRQGDMATASLIENWIDETERRAWFLAETLGERPRT